MMNENIGVPPTLSLSNNISSGRFIKLYKNCL